MGSVDARLRDAALRAARNNAEWCDAVCRAHGLRGEFGEDAWTCARRTPRYYPDAVTLSPDASAERVLSRIDVGAGCSIKDSFARLDPTSWGFRVLFEAEWIHREPPEAGPPGGAWRPVRDAAGLRAWEAAWGDGQEEPGLFPPALLAEPTVALLGGWSGGRLIAGCAANLGPAVVGISNLFVRAGDPDAAWAGVVAAAASHFPGHPVVGYERDEPLAAAMRQGFSPAGRLRVWLREAAEAAGGTGTAASS
ncbi:MAG: hypothetical protein E6J41_29710 [Chloroflexi bacterium]|nr:MAG: hypothetical protein E6J41_29710 [Chloroflexota bacterium]